MLRFKSTIAALTAIVACSSVAAAPRIEVGAGISQAAIHDDGVWYQKAFPHKLNTRSPTLLLGLTDDWNSRWRWHLDVVYLGRNSVDSWDTPNDENYNPRQPTGCNGVCLPLVNYKGSGSVAGIAATAEMHTSGTTQVGVEAGPFLYYASWKLQVPGWYPSVQTAPGIFQQSDAPTNLAYNDKHIALGWVVGLRAQRGPWSLSYRLYADKQGFKGHGSDPWPPIWEYHHTVMVVYTFN